jgi:uncharacterized membrane protein
MSQGKAKMKEYASTPERNEVALVRGNANIAWTILLGLIGLSGGISSLQNMASSFADDANYSSLIANWIPWIAALVFVTGWLMTHWIEIAVLQRRNNMVRVLIIALLLSMIGISLVLINLVVHPVFHRLGSVFTPMVLSGYAFRLSTFRKESLSLLPSTFFGEKKKH